MDVKAAGVRKKMQRIRGPDRGRRLGQRIRRIWKGLALFLEHELFMKQQR